MQLSKGLSATTRDYWRIVLALATKDIVDALRNKTTLTLLIGLGLMIVTVQALPLMLKLDDRPRVAIYDAARSGVADDLRRDRLLQVSEMRSAEDARNMAPEASGPLLALILPADWESNPGALQADGYLAHWIGTESAVELVGSAERALAAVTGRPVTIETQTLYPTLDSRGHNIMVAAGLVLATVLITAILVPHLILEEKTGHTLEVLRVSPAGISQILLGKGLAGLVYGVLAAAALLAFNLAMVNQWSLMLAAVLAIILFGVGLGLLVGTMAENEGTVQMWVGLLAVLLLFPLFLSFANSSRLPAWLQEIVAWLPTTAAFDLIRLSFGNTSPAALIWPSLLALVVAVVLVFAVAGWRLRSWQA
jgi:ABC-type multidrug transport system permease subunit